MSNKRVLVADDEVHILDVVSYKLQNAGLEVITARDGQEALEQARAELPDLIVIDYQMPALNGLEVCLQLREEQATSRIPVIMLTARGLDVEQSELDRANISAVIAKPFSPREVLGRVEELLGREDAELPIGKAQK